MLRLHGYSLIRLRGRMSTSTKVDTLCGSPHVFTRVASRLEKDDAARSLWLKVAVCEPDDLISCGFLVL